MNYSYSGGKRYQEIQTNTRLNLIKQRLLDSTVYNSPYHNQNWRAGYDYSISKTDNFGVLVTATESALNNITNTNTGIYASDHLDSTRFSTGQSPRKSRGVNINLNLKLAFDSAGKRTLTMDADAGLFDFKNDNDLV